VHVDEESLREWFNDNEEANTTRYIQTVLAEGPTSDFGSMVTFFASIKERTNPEEEDLTNDTQIGSEFLFADIFDATLKAFVSDRNFGLDAYLSRRIRHGTLSGNLLTPVTRVLKRLSEVAASHGQEHQTGELAGINVLVQDWREFLLNELDRIRKDILQINTPAHPRGLIRATWRSAANIAHLDATIARVRSRVIEGDGSYDVFPDIYSLCWDCLESDLAQLRRYMVLEFEPRAATRLNKLFGQLSHEEQLIAYAFKEELLSTLLAKVQEVCGWFIRPVFRRDRYDLKMLITSTLSIVRELDTRYEFSEEVAVPYDISLNRPSFDLFGDVLFVLIGNAARHGKANGRITVSAESLPTNGRLVSLEVTSEMSTLDEYQDALSRIRSAAMVTEVDTINQAAVEEGFSGLRKLVGLLLRLRSEDVQLQVVSRQEHLSVTFCVTLPAELIATRERRLS
jgi:hypothetical protein